MSARTRKNDYWAGVRYGEKRTLNLLRARGMTIPPITEGLGEPEPAPRQLSDRGSLIFGLLVVAIAFCIGAIVGMTI